MTTPDNMDPERDKALEKALASVNAIRMGELEQQIEAARKLVENVDLRNSEHVAQVLIASIMLRGVYERLTDDSWR